MTIEIIGSVDKTRLYCAGSNTKFITTFTVLSFLSENNDLSQIVDDPNFLTQIATTPDAKNFLQLFEKLIGSHFSIHDLCSYYTGLPYTFELADEELASVEAGNPFKHHSILDEKTFLSRCHNQISPLYRNHSKFHYSEIAIIFLGYIVEKIYSVSMEELYQHYIIKPFRLSHSQFSRTRPKDVYCQDLSDKYDYPSIAILDHGYFAYSNGFYTTLNDMKTVLENLMIHPVFHLMTDIKRARAASHRLLNGMAVELRLVGDDIIYGYDGLSFSGCNLWAYSTKRQQGYITSNNSEEEAFKIDYAQFGSPAFDTVPAYTEIFYKKFQETYKPPSENVPVPIEYQGKYHRVKINEKDLADVFELGDDFMVIRNPEEWKYALICVDGRYYVQGKDHIHNAQVSLYKAKSNHHYMLYDGTLYRKIKIQS
jgi:CubicO group peptidase (beta-lactamase class C family)